MQPGEIKQIAIRTIELEAESVAALAGFVTDDFLQVVEKIHSSQGRLVVSGIGKSAIIAQKIVATLNSTGTPALYMHAADAIHGDLGMITPQDLVLIISKSGNSPEIKVLVPFIKNFGNLLIGMVGNIDSYLAQQANFLLNTTVSQEACPNNLAPTSSTTAQMVMGDALAVCLMRLKGFTGEDFAKFHPGGALGKKLYLRVADLIANNEAPSVLPQASITEVVLSMTRGRLGATVIVGTDGQVAGIITDGDLRRMIEKNLPVANLTAYDIGGHHPRSIAPDALAVTALDEMRQNDITHLVVIQNNQYQGLLHLHDLIKEGLI